MPVYEYRCRECNRPSSIFFRSLASVEPDPTCAHCGARALDRRMSRVWVHGRAETAADAGPAFESDDVPVYGDFDRYGDDAGYGDGEDFDPVTFAREAREMARVMGEPLERDFDEALRHIEHGADPEDVFGEMDAAAPESAAEPASSGDEDL